MTYGTVEVHGRAGTRRRSTRRCSRRSLLIFVELMLVTAIALFFSTFSSPFLVGGPDARAVGDRPLQRGPAELRAGRRIEPAAWARARRSTTCCRTSRPSTSSPRSSTDGRCRIGYMAWTSRLRGAVHRAAARHRHPHLLADGTSSERAPARLPVARQPGCRRARLRRHRSSRLPAIGAIRESQVDDRCSTYARAETLKRLVLSFDALAADVYWIRAIQHYGGERRSTSPRQLRPAVPACSSSPPRSIR